MYNLSSYNSIKSLPNKMQELVLKFGIEALICVHLKAHSQYEQRPEDDNYSVIYSNRLSLIAKAIMLILIAINQYKLHLVR